MSKIIPVIMLIALLLAGYAALKPLPDAIQYAAAWDAGNPPDTFSKLSGLDSMNSPDIQQCRKLWMAEKLPINRH
jgi:hypothetical protein